MPKESAFEQHTHEYESWFLRNAVVYESELAAIRTLLPKSRKGLEIGVGSGLFASRLGIKSGVDPSLRMLEKARLRGIEVFRGAAELLPFASEEFDFALMVTTVCFLDDIDLAFSEAHRVIKPKGSFLIAFVDKNSPLGKSYEEKKEQSRFYKDATFFGVPELVMHLTRSGFHEFRFCQTLLQPLDMVKQIEPVEEGYGRGSFVVIRAEK